MSLLSVVQWHYELYDPNATDNDWGSKIEWNLFLFEIFHVDEQKNKFT